MHHSTVDLYPAHNGLIGRELLCRRLPKGRGLPQSLLATRVLRALLWRQRARLQPEVMECRWAWREPG